MPVQDTTFEDIKSSVSSPVSRREDRAEKSLAGADRKVRETTGVSMFHLLTLGSIIGSIALYLSGRKAAGIFVGLWPPTFQALRAIVHEQEHRDLM